MSTLFINSITDNNIISSVEAQTGFNITGGGQPGATVSLTFDSGQELAGGNTTVVNDNGQWSVQVVAADVKAFSQGMEKVTATQTLGNTPLEVFRTFTVNALFIDSPVIDPITDTAIFNAASAATSLTITGTGQPGATLILGFTSGRTLTGNNTTIVREDGTWSVDIAVADIFIFAQGGEVLTATQSEGEGNSLPTTQPLLNQSGFTRIFGTDGDDELFAPSTGNAQVFGLEGNDILDATPSQGQVMLFGAPGNDTLIGGNNHTLYGGDGDDTLSAAGSIGRNILYGEAGNDLLIVVEGSHNELYGGEDNDRLIISDGGGFNRLYGEAGDDILDASSGTGNNQLFGGEGDDRLIAGAPTDELFGGEGDDNLFAGNGGILTGDGGANTFYLANGSIPSELAIITDFKPGGDRLVIAGLPDLTGVKLIPEGADTILIAVLSDTEVRLALLKGIQPTALVAGRDVFSQTESLLENVIFVILDTLPPTVTITDNTSNIATGDINYTFTFSEAVTGFTAEDITVTNGSKGTFTPVSPTEYTLVVTPNPNFEGNLTVAVAAGAALDSAGNPSIAPEVSVQPVDIKAPTVTIADNTSNIATGDINYTFTFSEPVTDFTTEDITVTNGSKGTFTPVSPTEYTLVVTPNPNFEGNLTVAVAAGAALDSAGNPSIAPEVSVQPVDIKAPTVTIADNTSNIATGDINYTFTFSEPVTDFTTEDITVTNGSKGTFTPVSPTEYTLVVTPNPNFEGNLTVAVAAGAALDSAGNPSIAPEVSVQPVDIKAPTVTIADNTSNIATGDINYTFTFSEPVTDFTTEDITVTNGSKGTFTPVSPTEYTLVVTPNPNFEGNLTVAVAAGAALDSAGNPSIAPEVSVQPVDIKAPTVTIADNTSNIATGDINYTFTFSEPVTDFTTEDITVTNGSKGTFTPVSPTEYTLVVTPNPNFEGNLTVAVAAGAALDSAGNPSIAPEVSVQPVDIKAPTVTIADNTSNIATGDINYTFTFSEPVTDFTTEDITVTNGSKGTFTPVSPTEYTLVVTPNPNFEGNLTVAVAAGAALDSAGNPSIAPEVSVQPVDIKAPTVTIADNTSNIATGDINYTFTFSEPVTDFTAEDITVTNGSKGTFTPVSPTEYTLVVTPNPNFEGNLTVAVAAGAAIDSAGNPSIAPEVSVQPVDTIAPTVTIADNTSNIATGDINYTFTFSEAVTGFTAEDITVTNGSKGTFTPVSSTEYTLVVTPNPNFEGNLTVAVAAGAAIDSAGNPSIAPEVSVQPVDTIAPTVTIADNTSNIATGDINYTFTFSEAVTGFTAEDITVTNGSKGTFTPVSPTEYTLVVTPNPNFEGNLTVAVAAGAAIDSAGNPSIAPEVSVQPVDTKAPTVTITDNTPNIATGDINYTFTFSEAVTGFTIEDITVTNGSKGTFTPVSPTEYTLVVTPNPNFEGNLTVAVAAGAAIDSAGNPSIAPEVSVQPVDTKAPTVTITDNTPNIATGDINYTFTFSEAVTGFTIEDITVTNGSKGTFTVVSPTGYTLVVTPNPNFAGNLTVAVAAGAAIDSAGNPSIAPEVSVQPVDTTVLNITGVTFDGYISEAEVTRLNGTGGSVTTDTNGRFSFTGLGGTGIIRVRGGVDVSTGQPFTGELRAPANAGVITPVTTLVVALLGDNAETATALEIQAATDQVRDILNLPATIDLLNDDPIEIISGGGLLAADALQFQRANVQLGLLLQAATGTEVGFIGGAQVLAQQILAGQSIDLTSADFIVEFLNSAQQAGVTLSQAAQDTANFAQSVSQSNSAIATVDNLNAIAQTQANLLTRTLGLNEFNPTPVPTITITSQPAVDTPPTGDPNYQFQVRYTFTFSEPVTGFTSEDITVTNGTKGTFTGNNGETVYTLLVGTNVVTRDALGDTGLRVAVQAGAATGNNSGNPSPAAALSAPATPVINLVGEDDRVNRQEQLNGFAITGTGTPGAEIILRFDSEPNSSRPGKQTTVQSDGTWSIAITTEDVDGFDQGEEGVFVYQNLNGNVSPQRSRFINVDTIAPRVTITSIGGVDNRVSGVAADNTVVGTAEPGSGNVTIRLGNTELGTTAVNENGNFTYSLTEDNLTTIGQGTGKTITASQTDSAGNIGTSTPFTFGVDTIAPTVTITSIGGVDNRVTGVAADNTVVGTAEPGSGNVSIRLGNTELGTTAVDENGNFTYSLTEDNLTTIGQGTGKTITASQRDSAGNIGTSTPFTFGVDTIAPRVTITSIGGVDNRVSGVAGDNTVVGTAEPGSGNVTIRFGNTQLGTTAVNENGNFTYSLTTANITTIGQGTGKTITASQTDSAGNIGTSTPFTFGVDTIAPTVIIRDPNTGTPVLQQPFDTVFRFSITGSTPSSQELQVVFGDGTTQSILTTLGNASGLPSGIDSILNNLQSGLLSISQENGNVTTFRLRQVGTRNITPLTIGQVTANGFTLTGGGFNITAEVLGSPDTVIISTQKIEVNGDELEAISLNNLDTSNVTGERITVQVDATLYREAAFDNLVGFYLAERTTGAVVDRLTGQSIGLGDRNAYLSAVRDKAVLTSSVANNQTRDLRSNFEVNSSLDLSDYVLLPFLVANSTLNSSDFSNLYVASMRTNSDRSDHVQLLGNNVFGFEDIAGGGDNDFDDVIFQVRGLSVV